MCTMKIKGLMTLIILICCLFFSACDFSPVKNNVEVSGNIYFESLPMDDVIIKSTTKIYTTTNSDGSFNFETNNTPITIYAEKEGYTFSPKNITISSTTNNIVFTAIQTTNLNGTLCLDSVNITPTSIVSINDNFQYANNGNNCLKIKSFNLKLNNLQCSINVNEYAIKNKSNIIKINNDISVDTGTEFSLYFSLNCYFKQNNLEYIYTEDNQSVLNIKEVQTTKDLTDNNQVEYSFMGVNSSNNKFSYNITFIFDYYPNI